MGQSATAEKTKRGPQKGVRIGGRQKGSLNKSTLAKIEEQRIRAAELTIGKHEKPVDFLLEVMRQTDLPLRMRISAAEKAAPYIHYRLVANDHSNIGAMFDPERTASAIREDIRKLLGEMGVQPTIIEGLVGPGGDVKLLDEGGAGLGAAAENAKPSQEDDGGDDR